MEKYTDTFEEVLGFYCKKLGLHWYEVLDSENFELVEQDIAQLYNVATASEVPYFNDWKTNLVWEL